MSKWAVCVLVLAVTACLFASESFARPHYFGTAEDTNGNTVSGALVTVYAAGTLNKASLYDAAGSAIGNPVNTDSLGLFDFYIDDGTYDLVFSKTGKTFYNNRYASVAIGGGGGGAGVTDGDKGDITVSGSGATWTIDAAAKTHQLLSTQHTDTVAGSPVTGDLLIGDAGNLWSTLGGPTSATERCFNSTGTGTTANPPYWGPCSPINAQTGTTYTVVLADSRKLVTLSNASSIAVTLPQATTAGFASGFYFYAKTIGAGTATITPTTSTINGAATLVLAQGEGAIIWSDGTNYQALEWAASSGSSSPALNSTTFIVEEEFCSGIASAGNVGDKGLYNASGTVTAATPVAAHPCVINMATAASGLATGRLFFAPNDGAPMVMGDLQKMRFILRPQSLDADTSIRCGFIVTNSTTLEGSDGVYFSYLNSASANWRAVTRVTSLTATNSSVAAGSGTWVQFDITRNGSNWDFSINEAAAFATPATSTGPAAGATGKIGCVIETAAAAAKNIDYDYMGFSVLSPLAARHP